MLLESQEVQDFRGSQEKEAYPDLQARREMLALLEKKDQKERRGLMERGGFLVPLDLLVPVDQTE